MNELDWMVQHLQWCGCCTGLLGCWKGRFPLLTNVQLMTGKPRREAGKTAFLRKVVGLSFGNREGAQISDSSCCSSMWKGAIKLVWVFCWDFSLGRCPWPAELGGEPVANLEQDQRIILYFVSSSAISRWMRKKVSGESRLLYWNYCLHSSRN